MKNLDLISNMEAHLLVSKAVDSTIESLKESPLQSIREAADYWGKQMNHSGIDDLSGRQGNLSNNED